MWPYLLITIPIAVVVNMSDASKYINQVLSLHPAISIVLATAVGAFSPFCSCSVIPVIASLLIGGVPLAPVMSFWLASPSMDPEIFFLSASSLGWKLAVWRLGATFTLSLGGGFITHALTQREWLGGDVLRDQGSTEVKSLTQVLSATLQTMWIALQDLWGEVTAADAYLVPVQASACCEGAPQRQTSPQVHSSSKSSQGTAHQGQMEAEPCAQSCEVESGGKKTFWQRLFRESWSATAMVAKYMVLAWLIGALIQIYVPQELIYTFFNGDHPGSIFSAALLGVPVYTSNLSAIPMIGELLKLGMKPAAALAFLVAGPITTLPAMSAVWGLVNRKVFGVFMALALFGAVAVGYLYGLLQSF